jgi:hypothetical protein
MLPTEMKPRRRRLHPAGPGITITRGDHLEEARSMKKFGLVSVVSGALVAAVIGLAAPADARTHRDHDYLWWDQLVPTVVVPHVDTTVHH